MCRAALCCAVLCRVMECLVAARCTAVCCAALCCVASCCAVLPCAMVCDGLILPPCQRAVASALVRVVRFVVLDAGRRYVVGSWPGGAVRCGAACWVCAALVSVCLSGWGFRRPSAGLPSLGASALVPCPLGFLAPMGVPVSVGRGVVVPSVVLGPPILSLCLFVVICPGCRGLVPFSLWCRCCGVHVVALAVTRVVAWRLGSGLGLRGVLSGSLCGCTPFFPPVGVPPFPYVEPGGRWARPGAVRAASGPGCSGESWRYYASGGCWGGLLVGKGGAVPSRVACPSFVCVPVCCCALSPSAMAPGLSLSWPSGTSSPLCCVALSALSLWAPACYLGPLLAPLPGAFSLPFPFPVQWWWVGGEACGAPMAHARGWVV